MRFKAHARAGNYCDKRGAQPWHLFRVANILATCPWPSFLFITSSTPSFSTLATPSRPGPKRLILLTEIYQNFANTIDSDSRTWNIQHNTFKNMTLNECSPFIFISVSTDLKIIATKFCTFKIWLMLMFLRFTELTGRNDQKLVSRPPEVPSRDVPGLMRSRFTTVVIRTICH